MRHLYALNYAVLAAVIAAVLTLLLPSCVGSGAGPASHDSAKRTDTTEPSELAPRDPAVTQGQLANGLRYLIQPGDAGGAEVRLVIDVGSLDERDDEAGFAHFIEHMAFRKTARFDDGQIIAFLRGLGASFGQHLNAITGYDRTVFWLGLPRDKTAALGTAMQIVADWAGGIVFDAAQVDIERGVVLTEKRGREQQRDQNDEVSRTLYDQPLYNRGILGTEATLQGASAAKLRAFRDRNYVPQRMTVIVTGQLAEGIDYWRGQIEREFGVLPSQPQAVAAQRPPFLVKPRTRVIALEKGGSHAVAIAALHRTRVSHSMADLRQDLVTRLCNMVLGWRIQALARRDGDIVSAAVVDGAPSADSGLIEFVITMAAPLHQDAIGKLADFTTSLRATPPSADEMARGRDAILANARRNAVEQSRLPASALGARLAGFALRGSYLMSPDQTATTVQALLPQITPDELVGSLDQRLASKDFLITLLSPNGLGRPTLDRQQAAHAFEARLVSTQRAAKATPVDAIAQPALAMMTAAPPPGQILDERWVPELAATRMTMANGAIVWIAAVNDNNDSVALRVSRRGGFWSLPPALISAGRLAQYGVLTEAGYGPLDADQVSRLYSGSLARFSMYLGNERHGMSAGATRASTELVLQTLHRFVQAPRLDDKVLAKNVAFARQRALADRTDPAEQFELDWVRSVRGNSAYLETPSASDYEAVSLAQMGEVHRLIFGDVSGMHFVFTGNVDVAQLRPLVARYIASLPGEPSAVNEADRSRSSTGLAIQAAALPAERTGIRVERQTNPAQRAFLRVRYVNPAVARTPENMVMALHMRRAIAERIRVQLRANLGLVYSPTVSIDFRDSQATGLTANMQATVDPDNVPLVESELQATVRGLIAQPISSEELAALLAAEQDWQSQFGRSSATTSALLTEISLNQITAQQFVAAREQARQLTAIQLQQAFAQIFNDVSPSVGIYRPDPSKVAGASSLTTLRSGPQQ